ncbi:MAG: hypothetical protein KC613_20825 [Myxococcales bacterium]|nr:hypothetical protein [Myxococcales bacterium]
MRIGPFDCVLELQPNGSWFGRVWGWGGLLASGPADSRHQGMVECESVCANVATNVLDVLGSSAQVGRRAVGSSDR